MPNLSKNTKIQLVQAPIAAATTDATSSVVDMQNFEGCLFIATVGTEASSAGGTVKIQHASASSGSWADVNGASQAFAGTDDDKALVIDCYRPVKRYLRAVLDASSSAGTEFGGIVAQQYGAHKMPRSSTGLVGNVLVVSGT